MVRPSMLRPLVTEAPNLFVKMVAAMATMGFRNRINVWDSILDPSFKNLAVKGGIPPEAFNVDMTGWPTTIEDLEDQPPDNPFFTKEEQLAFKEFDKVMRHSRFLDLLHISSSYRWVCGLGTSAM